MKLLGLLLLLVSYDALACWKVEGSLGIDGETYKIHQKFDYGKEYILPMGSFLLKLTFIKGKAKIHTVKYALEEKKATSLILVTKGEEEVTEEKTKDIFAKGEEGQPNTIITLKLNHI